MTRVAIASTLLRHRYNAEGQSFRSSRAGDGRLGAVLPDLRERAPAFKVEHFKIVLDAHDH
jgi:hypothetical protein